MAVAALHRSEREREDEHQQLLVRIELASDWPRAVPLTWRTGAPGGKASQNRETTIKLMPGGYALVPMFKAESWFGQFTLPEAIKHALDRRVAERLATEFAESRRRVNLQWGEFPRPKKYERDGLDQLGPHRMPNVTVTVIGANGQEQPPIHLRSFYGFDDFNGDTLAKDAEKLIADVEFNRKSTDALEIEREARLAAEAKAAEIGERLARLEGMMAMLPAVAAAPIVEDAKPKGTNK